MKKLYSSIVLGLVLLAASVGSLKATTYYYMGGGASPTLPSSWSTSSVTSGSLAPSSFTGTNTWTFFGAMTLTLSSTWTVAPAATVVFGDGTNALTFVMANNIGTTYTVGTGHPFFNIKNNATLILQASQTFGSNRFTIASGSTFQYDSGSPNVIPTTSAYSNIIINNNVALSNVTTVNGTLTINSGKTLTMGGWQLTVGAVAGSGEFIGDNIGSLLSFSGSGALGTLYFQAGSRMISGLTVPSGTLILGNDLSIDGTNGGSGLTLTSSMINLNGHTLSFDNTPAVTLGSGSFLGSSASSLLFNSASSISGNLNMNASGNTLKVLFLNASGQTLTLANALNITDSVCAPAGTIASGGNLTLKATSSLKGRVGMTGANAGSGSISGNVTVETFMRQSGQTTGWTMLGASGLSNMTIGSWDGQFPITCVGCTYDPSTVGGFYSVQGYAEDGMGNGTYYDTTVTSSTALTPGKGFWVYLGTGSGTTNAITTVNSGPLVQGTVAVQITNSNSGNAGLDGYNLLANPYASPISWDKLYAANSGGGWLAGTIYLWSASSGQVSYTQGSGYNIPAGEGFYVNQNDVFSSPSTLVFDESMKMADNTTNEITRTAQHQYTGFKLKITGSNGDVDRTEFIFRPGATTNFDQLYDAHKMFRTPGYMGTGPVYDHYTTISSQLQNNYYFTNNLPVLTNSLSVPIVARVSATGTYSISLDDVNNYSSCTILKDKLTGQYHDLAVSPYVCTINDSTSAARFELALCEMATTTSVKEFVANMGDIQIIQEDVPVVTTHFAQSTKATISVFNVVGQQLINNLEVEGTDTKTRLNINSHNEVIFVRVVTDKETVTRKIITH